MGSDELDVIVCVHDRIRTLGRALDSIRAASDVAEITARITVLDGGSTDGSIDLALSQPGIRLVHQQGLGLAAARNEALAATSAPVVAWLDSDDAWPVDSLIRRLDVLDHDPTADLVTGSVAFEPIVDQPSDRYRDRWSRTARGLTPGAWLARRTVYDTVGPFDEELRIGSDTDWFTRALDTGCRLVELDEVVLVKGIGLDNASHDVTAYRTELLEIVRRHHRRRPSDNRDRPSETSA